MVVFRLLRPRPAHKSPSRWRKIKTYTVSIVKGTASKPATTLPKETLSDLKWKFLLLSSSYPDIVPCPCSWIWSLARDRHVCVRGGCKVPRISRKTTKHIGDVSLPPTNTNVTCLEVVRERLSLRLSNYWRSRRKWKISVFYKKTFHRVLLRDIALVASQSNTYYNCTNCHKKIIIGTRWW